MTIHLVLNLHGALLFGSLDNLLIASILSSDVVFLFFIIPASHLLFFQIKKLGINKLEIINKDTFSGKNSYFSARRSLIKKQNDYGRNISLIMIN